MESLKETVEPSAQPELQVTKKDLRKVFWRSFTLQGSFNYERMQALGYAYSMIPVLKKLYPDPEERAKALKRHLEFFNSTPQMSTFIMGLSAAMEEKAAKDKEFDADSINSVKVALMGPVAGIGDSFFWGTFRIIAAGVGVSLASTGNILGAILFLLIFNVPHLLVRYQGTFMGYSKGTTFLNMMYQGGSINRLTYAAGILGLLVIGAMTGTLIELSTPIEFQLEGASVALQDTLDDILPQALPLGLTFGIYYMLKKNVKVNYIMLGIIALGILGTWVGIL
ncbi:PTS system mannose/fructose/sorbose family transporter subunit IID [Shouchella clausii]|uniref:PTS mannose transporter subunit IID n=1 Tax=Shouchella clausii TaxID=79880 RepID=A0A268S0F4_SHOCL|nr:PTS system mannose/fructose/sorbose family transporter subunit IID [Shouchella clausii]PAE96385.1 PTS mannose transporter subunit IID [Shouchella clausii]PAF25995.1 PTS mannose transporter subunit IID [Shouchella clausii]